MADLENIISSELKNASYGSISEQKDSVADNMKSIYIDSLDGIEEEFNPSYINETIQNLYLALHPVGDIVINETGENPGDIYGGKWELFGPGRTLVGVDYTKQEYKKANLKGGKKYHLHRHAIVEHTHNVFPHKHNMEHSHVIGKHTHLLKPHSHEIQHRHTFQHTHEFYHSHLQSIGWEEESQYFISLDGNLNLTETQNQSAYYWKVSKKFELRSIPRAFTSWKIVIFQQLPELFLGEATTQFTGEAQVPFKESTESTKSTISKDTSLNRTMQINEQTKIKNDIGDTNPKTSSAYLSTLQPYVVCYIFRRIA